MPRSSNTLLRSLPFVTTALVSLVVLFTPDSGVPTAPPGTDKVVHVALFGALALTGRWAGVRVRALLPVLACYAVGSEPLQGTLPIGRSTDAMDALADLLGVLAGLAAHRGLSAAVSRSSRRGRPPTG